MAKRKLRDLSRQDLSADEFEMSLATLDTPDIPDMIAAVFAATLVEYQLEQVLKLNFRRNDSNTWARLTDGAGAMRDFYSKIMLGYALSSFDEDIRSNLNIVRDIRNAFAHSRTVLKFDNREIAAELRKVRPVRKGDRLLEPGALILEPSKRAYLQLCMALLMYFGLKLEESLKRKERRIKDNLEAREFLQQLVTAIEAKKARRGQ